MELASEAALSLLGSFAVVVFCAQLDQIVRILADESDWLVVYVCAIVRWPWFLDFLVKLERVRVVRIVALGERRGPAPEARALYDEIDGG